MVRTSLLLALSLVVFGCNKGADDPLTGTWSNTTCYGLTGMPAEIQSCSVSLAFSAALGVTLTDSRFMQAANATYPRCTITRRTTGPTYSTMSDMTMTISGGSTSTMERTDCVNPADNVAATADNSVVVPTGTFQYQIAGNTLTISGGPLAGMYTR